MTLRYMRRTAVTFALLTAAVLELSAAKVLAQSRPQMLDPRAGSTLPGSRVTFTWSANGVSVNNWWLYIGTGPAKFDVVNSGSLTQTFYSADGLPVTGVPLYVRLWYNAGSWAYIDYQYGANPGYDVPCPCFTAQQLDALYDQWVAGQSRKVTNCIEDDRSASKKYPPYTEYYIQACVDDICDLAPKLVASVGATHPLINGVEQTQIWTATCLIGDEINKSYILYDGNLNRREVEVCAALLRASKWGKDVACGP